MDRVDDDDDDVALMRSLTMQMYGFNINVPSWHKNVELNVFPFLTRFSSEIC